MGRQTPPDLAALAERHVPYARDPDVPRGEDDPTWCQRCDLPWPCDARLVLDALEAWSDRDEWHAKAVDRGVDLDRCQDALDEARAELAAERRQYGVSMKAMLIERDAARAEVAQHHALIRDLRQESGALRSDAKRLAEALLGSAGSLHDEYDKGEFEDCEAPYCRSIRDVLAAHDEALR